MDETVSAMNLISLLIEYQSWALDEIRQTPVVKIEPLKLRIFASKGEFSKLTGQIRSVPVSERHKVGVVITEVKQSIDSALQAKQSTSSQDVAWTDVTMPGIRPPEGHLHIVTQAILEITRIFERIGFNRVRHPEVDYDWYAFESLNMPPNHPARDEWETFFLKSSSPTDRYHGVANPPGIAPSAPGKGKLNKMVLTPHTSNGQVREMEKGKLPIRMINIAKCYRRQIDVSHTPMFHQFEGLYVDTGVSIAHLKGVMDYFAVQFFGPDRKIRLRPFHFQFTEPSFEVDINCGICLGSGKLSGGESCRLCKSGWLELGGSGMVHPTVLKNGGIDPEKYSGFAFGWGIERTAMMKSGTKLDDIRTLYSNDLRFLEQF
jgi:phenylalanyl-tRNA synthetase alpha chain